MSIQPKTITEAQDLIDKAEGSRADLIEVRLDNLSFNYKNQALTNLSAYGKTPKIATIRPVSSQGMFSGTEQEQKHTLLAAAKSGFEYIDVELSTSDLKKLVNDIKGLGTQVIVSFHDFSRSLSAPELNSVLDREVAADADICKIVTTAKRIEDNLEILNFIAKASKKTKVVGFAMEELGKISRLLSPTFGAAFTFAALEKGSETATGQMTIQEMNVAYRLLGLK